jgi:hypothetical protein
MCVAAAGFVGTAGPGIGPGAAVAQMAPYDEQFDQYDLIPPYRIAMVVRSAGLFPVAPAVRQGPNYVVRAVDRYGTPMRVWVDGYYGQILAARRLASLYPRETMAPRFDRHADPTDVGPYGVPPGARPPAPVGQRPGGAAIPNVRHNGSDTAVTTVVPERAGPAVAPAPIPRAKPSPGASAAAAVKPVPEPSPAHASASVPPATEKQQKPADQTFPPVQPLE